MSRASRLICAATGMFLAACTIHHTVPELYLSTDHRTVAFFARNALALGARRFAPVPADLLRISKTDPAGAPQG